ncbi:hypothetical protein B0T40_03200 [Chromobacterium haemolyticum]|uniref:hypothetical protein n=1 Tax=Chromobacterium haemolyticum TaxID=394935 RepID=UPI0009D9AA50|nr:hypothetical protein [Chromobacterium haemolyticum]OQS39755.1 hypothetical protein B0T40_03200 [Chromobacterium haemolyticum]
MNMEQALQEAQKGRLIGRRDWPASKAVRLDIGISVDSSVQLYGEAVHPLQPGSPVYRPAPEDSVASDWIALD